MNNQLTFKKVSSYGVETTYHMIGEGITIPFVATKTSDKIGTLYTIECSLTGYFQEYGMNAVKSRLSTAFINKYSNH